MLVGSTTRYLGGRHALQTVYWRKTANGARGLLKTKKTCSFGKNEGVDKVNIGDLFAQVRARYSQ